MNSSNGVGNDVNVSVVDTDLVYGDRNQTLGGNATFVYGRFIPRDVRVFGSVPFSANGWYEVYKTSSIGGTALSASRNENDWFINNFHNDLSDGDANVTLVQTGVNPANAAALNGVEGYNFNAMNIGGYQAHITTDSWLWYGVNASAYADPSAGNTNCLTHPCFNINVVPPIGATGSAKTEGEATKTNKSSTTGGAGWKSTSDYAPAIR